MSMSDIITNVRSLNESLSDTGYLIMTPNSKDTAVVVIKVDKLLPDKKYHTYLEVDEGYNTIRYFVSDKSYSRKVSDSVIRKLRMDIDMYHGVRGEEYIKSLGFTEVENIKILK